MSTTLNSTVNPTVFAQLATFTATVSALAPGSGTPTGTVSFYDGSTLLGTGTLNGGIATFTTASLSVSSHAIKAVYGGDTNFKTSTSAILTQVVQSTAGAALAMGAAPAGSPLAIAAAPAVDQAIAALQDEAPAGFSVHDLALDKVATRVRRRTAGP